MVLKAESSFFKVKIALIKARHLTLNKKLLSALSRLAVISSVCGCPYNLAFSAQVTLFIRNDSNLVHG